MAEYASGTLEANGSEQTVVELTELAQLEGWIDLANMGAGDSVTIKVYAKLKVGGVYRQYDSSIYSGVQTNPALRFVGLPTKHGLKITVRQTAGTYRTFDFVFFKKAS